MKWKLKTRNRKYKEAMLEVYKKYLKNGYLEAGDVQEKYIDDFLPWIKTETKKLDKEVERLKIKDKEMREKFEKEMEYLKNN